MRLKIFYKLPFLLVFLMKMILTFELGAYPAELNLSKGNPSKGNPAKINYSKGNPSKGNPADTNYSQINASPRNWADFNDAQDSGTYYYDVPDTFASNYPSNLYYFSIDQENLADQGIDYLEAPYPQDTFLSNYPQSQEEIDTYNQHLQDYAAPDYMPPVPDTFISKDPQLKQELLDYYQDSEPSPL